MALVKSIEVPRIEIVNGNIQVAEDTVIKEDGVEISRTRHRHVLAPFITQGDAGAGWTHTATDTSRENATVQAIANAVWTDDVKNEYKTRAERSDINRPDRPNIIR
jgi:hypothetical protein